MPISSALRLQASIAALERCGPSASPVKGIQEHPPSNTIKANPPPPRIAVTSLSFPSPLAEKGGESKLSAQHRRHAGRGQEGASIRGREPDEAALRVGPGRRDTGGSPCLSAEDGVV